MQAPANTPAGGPVFYAGRFARRVREAGLPGNLPLLGDWDVLPAGLASVEDASTIVVLDPLSFPFDSLTGALREVPLIVFLPADLDADFLHAVFGEPVFGRLGFFDRVATADDGIWANLSQTYRWARGQLVRLEDPEPADALEEIAAILRSEAAEEGPFRGPGKAVHGAQGAALGPQFAAARGGRAPDVPFRVLEVGAGAGRWAASFDPAESEYRGLCESETSVLTARAEWPEVPFGRLGSDLRFPYDDEAFDLVFCVDFLAKHPDPDKRRLLGEMWRVTRPGGRMLFLEDFVRAGTREYVVPITAFVEEVLVATDWQVVMEHVESLRYPGEALTRGGVVAISRLGVPKRW